MFGIDVYPEPALLINTSESLPSSILDTAVAVTPLPTGGSTTVMVVHSICLLYQ